MNPILRWLQKRRERLDALPTLDDALLGNGAARYSWYRLRFVLLRALLRTVFRLAEVALFASLFPFGVLGPALIFRSLTLLAGGLWWGALETMRRDVRALGRQQRWPEASRRVEQWLAMSVILSLVSLGASGLWVLWGPTPFESFSVLDVYVLGCGLRLAIDVIVRTYHSGIYALRRVYRPVATLVAIDLAEITALGALWTIMGAWSLGISLAFAGLLRAAVALVYTRRAYGGERLQLRGPTYWPRALRRASWSAGHSLLSALGNSVTQLDALLVIALLFAQKSNGGGALMLAALFHVISPLQAAAFNWARLFYFDFKRLESTGSPWLLARFDRLMHAVAIVVPLPIAAATLLLMGVFWRGPMLFIVPALFVLAGARAWAALYHVRAFSLGDQAYLAKLALGLVVAASAVAGVGGSAAQSLWLMGGLLAAVLLVLGRPRRGLPESEGHAELLGLSTWVWRLLRHSGTVQIGVAHVDRRLLDASRLFRVLRTVVGDAPMVRFGSSTLVWYQSPQGDTRRELLVAAAGSIRELVLGSPADSGWAALEAGLPDLAWQSTVRAALDDQGEVGDLLGRSGDTGLSEARVATTFEPSSRMVARVLQVLEARVRAVASGARVVALVERGDPPVVADWQPRAVRQLIVGAMYGDSHFRRRGGTEAAVVAPAGLPIALVVVPRDVAAPATPGRSPDDESRAAPSSEVRAWRPAVEAALRRAELVLVLDAASGRSAAALGEDCGS